MNFDVIVIGLGAMGSATLYQLARRGARVLGIDRFHPPHAFGSSHGATRITRLSVGEGPEYVPLVRRSHRIWREIESTLGEELMLTTGGLVMGPTKGGGELHGERDFVNRTIELAQAFGIEHEVLEADVIGRRFPQFLLRGDERGYFEPEAGVLRPERCVAAQIELARRAGAQVLTGQQVSALAATGDAVTVRAGSDSHQAGRAVVTAGAWIPALVKGRYARSLRVQRQTLHWFRPDQPALYAPGLCPVFIWSHGATPSEAFYGVPMVDGVAGEKVGTQQHEVDSAPDALDRTVSRAESEAMHARHVRGRLRSVSALPVQAAACLYTTAPEARFIVDQHPEVERAIVVSACSGHGFKHSAALGEAVAETLLEGHPSIDLAPFALR